MKHKIYASNMSDVHIFYEDNLGKVLTQKAIEKEVGPGGFELLKKENRVVMVDGKWRIIER